MRSNAHEKIAHILTPGKHIYIYIYLPGVINYSGIKIENIYLKW